MKISKDKKYTTRNGLLVNIYTTEGGGKYPVHGAVQRAWDMGTDEKPCVIRSWDENGNPSTINGQHNEGYNLVPAAERVVIAVFKDESNNTRSTVFFDRTVTSVYASYSSYSKHNAIDLLDVFEHTLPAKNEQGEYEIVIPFSKTA